MSFFLSFFFQELFFLIFLLSSALFLSPHIFSMSPELLDTSFALYIQLSFILAFTPPVAAFSPSDFHFACQRFLPPLFFSGRFSLRRQPR